MHIKEVLEYANEQGYTVLDLANKSCNRCGTIVFNEKFRTKDNYPFYCPNCDENMFSFEVSKIDI